MPGRILVAESDAATRNLLVDTLKREGYEVSATSAGNEVLTNLNLGTYDLLLLDLNLPSESGIDLLRLVRGQNPAIRIIVVSTRRSFEAAIKGLHYQISDFLIKPLTPRKVLNSIQRSFATGISLHVSEGHGGYATPEDQVILVKDDVRINFTRRLIEWPGNQVHLTPSEGRLLRVFMNNPGRVLTNSEILKLTQGYDLSESEAALMLRPLISRLRQKISRVPGGSRWITNVRGIGYLYDRRETAD